MAERQPDNVTENGVEQSPAEHAGPESTFDAGQRLLRGAVEQIRISGASSAGPDIDSGGATVSAHRRWRRQLRDEEPEQASGIAGVEQPGEPSVEEPTLFPTPDPAPTELIDAVVSAPETATAPSERRSRKPARRRAAPAAAVGAALGADPLSPYASEEFDDLAVSAFEKPTRRRGGGQPATIGSPTADYIIRAESLAVGTAEPDAYEAKKPSHRRRRVVGLAVVAAIAVAAIAIPLATSGSDDSVTAKPARVRPRLAFDPVTTAEGARVVRVWKLGGPGGSQFTGRLTFTNATSIPLQTTFTEVIPKSLASSVTAITFDPQPVVVRADPVVQYSVTIPANDTMTAGYDITVAAEGATHARLEQWARDLAAEPDPGSTTTTTTAPPPTTVAPTPPTTVAPEARRPTTTPTTTPPEPPPGTQPEPTTTPTTTPPEPPPPPPPPSATGTIILRVSAPGTGTFGFSGPGGGLSLTTGGGGAESAPITVEAGTYSWTQSPVPSGWSPANSSTGSNIDCSDRDAGPFEQRSTVSGTTAMFNVQPGETVVCTWRYRQP